MIMKLDKQKTKKNKKKKVMQSLSVQSASRRRVWWHTKADMVEEEAKEGEPTGRCCSPIEHTEKKSMVEARKYKVKWASWPLYNPK